MPIPRVTTEFNSDVGTPPVEQYNDVVVFGRATGDNTPVLGFNNPRWFSDPGDVAAETGDGSDAHVAAQMLDTRGVDDYQVVILRETETTETLGDSDTTATRTGVSSNAPLSGTFDVTVSVDGTEKNVTKVVESPPSSRGEPGTDEAFVNYDTGEVYTDTETSGSGTGIELTSRSVNWTSGFDSVNAYDIDVAILADVRADRGHIGDIDQLVQWGTGHYVATPIAYANGAQFDSYQEYLELGWDIGSYVSAGSMMPIYHFSNDDVAASEAGKWATDRVWEDPSMSGRGYPGVNQTDSFPDALIGDPETNGTVEGGDPNDGRGAGNAIHPTRYGGTLALTNDLTTAGQDSDYRYIDIYRTEGLADHEVKRGLTGLLMDEDVNFTETGRLQILNKVDETLSQYEGDTRAWSDLEVDVPFVDELSEDMRGNRIWSPIGVQYRYNGSVHRFHVEFSTSV